ncbi:hypothetical protein FKW77_002697 [Venturia effusa]|uniref:Uncharacterized protein n=1 Tax=Venturia effusa TaxID=50376 RepID=A0A517LNN7_9PEZI|nr:hypothetical protein FKW77_002697 [Venturia effusa]
MPSMTRLQSLVASVPTLQDRSLSLPNELLLQIFGYVVDLDGDPPSVSKILLEPSLDLTRHEHQPLKTLSLVCQRWRLILLPNVFRYARVTLSRVPRWVCLCTSLAEEITRTGHRDGSQHTRNLIDSIYSRTETSPSRAITSNDPNNPMNMEYIDDDDSDLLSLSKTYVHWLPSIRGEVETFMKFVREKDLHTEIKSLVLQTDQELTPHPTAVEQTVIVQQVNIIWKTFLNTLRLGRLVIAAPPSTMAALTSTRDSLESWTFEMPLHYLCFSCKAWKKREVMEKLSFSPPSSPDSSPSTKRPKRVQARPHNIRPWTQMIYNEGTMLPGYAHYEWNFNCPPLILPILLNFIHRECNYIRHDLTCDRSPNITSLTYISNFPFAEHVKSISLELTQFKNLRDVTIKFAEMDYLDDENSRLGRGQTSDVWKEWEDSYKNIVKHFLKSARAGVSVECLDTVHTRLLEDVDKIMKENSLVEQGPMAGRSFLQAEIEGVGSERKGRWVRKDI